VAKAYAGPRVPLVPPGALVESTQFMPSLAAVIHPTKEMPPMEDTRWWRRNRDTGAA